MTTEKVRISFFSTLLILSQAMECADVLGTEPSLGFHCSGTPRWMRGVPQKGVKNGKQYPLPENFSRTLSPQQRPKQMKNGGQSFGPNQQKINQNMGQKRPVGSFGFSQTMSVCSQIPTDFTLPPPMEIGGQSLQLPAIDESEVPPEYRTYFGAKTTLSGEPIEVAYRSPICKPDYEKLRNSGGGKAIIRNRDGTGTVVYKVPNGGGGLQSCFFMSIVPYRFLSYLYEGYGLKLDSWTGIDDPARHYVMREIQKALFSKCTDDLRINEIKSWAYSEIRVGCKVDEGKVEKVVLDRKQAERKLLEYIQNCYLNIGNAGDTYQELKDYCDCHDLWTNQDVTECWQVIHKCNARILDACYQEDVEKFLMDWSQTGSQLDINSTTLGFPQLVGAVFNTNVIVFADTAIPKQQTPAGIILSYYYNPAAKSTSIIGYNHAENHFSKYVTGQQLYSFLLDVADKSSDNLPEREAFESCLNAGCNHLPALVENQSWIGQLYDDIDSMKRKRQSHGVNAVNLLPKEQPLQKQIPSKMSTSQTAVHKPRKQGQGNNLPSISSKALERELAETAAEVATSLQNYRVVVEPGELIAFWRAGGNNPKEIPNFGNIALSSEAVSEWYKTYQQFLSRMKTSIDQKTATTSANNAGKRAAKQPFPGPKNGKKAEQNSGRVPPPSTKLAANSDRMEISAEEAAEIANKLNANYGLEINPGDFRLYLLQGGINPLEIINKEELSRKRVQQWYNRHYLGFLQNRKELNELLTVDGGV